MAVYFSYGIYFKSPWLLPLQVSFPPGPVDVEFEEVGPAFFEQLPLALDTVSEVESWFRHSHLLDGSHYLCWNGFFEFLVSADGVRIFGRMLPLASLEYLQTYVMGQVISVALVRQGIEPLHSTVVVVDGEAVAFLGNSGFGKSTLAAAFIHSGYRVLTDDLLVIKKRNHEFLAQPGPARLKLFPEAAQALLASRACVFAMNPYTQKLVFCLVPDLVVSTPTPVNSCYILEAPGTVAQGEGVVVRKLSFGEACMGLVRNSYNTIISEPDRHTRQFKFVAELAANLSLMSLTYPRELSKISDVVDAVVRDVRERRRNPTAVT